MSKSWNLNWGNILTSNNLGCLSMVIDRNIQLGKNYNLLNLNREKHFITTQNAPRASRMYLYDFLIKNNIGICDIVECCTRKKMDASDLGMENIELRNLPYFIKKHPYVKTLLLTGGNSKNGPEYHLRRLLKAQNISLITISEATPKIHSFEINENRIIKVVSLTAPTGTANRAVGSNPEYKLLKKQNPKFNTFDFRVLQYKKFFNYLCEPSQNGPLLVALQVHKCFVSVFSATNTCGLIPCPLCFPSQNG